MKNLKIKDKVLWSVLGLSLVIIVADRVSKEIVWNNFRNLIVWNKGISLGFLSPDNLMDKILLQAVIVVAILGFLYWLFSESKKVRKNYSLIIPLAMVVSGGMSNLIDRALWGSVMDFIPFFSIWTFNIADFSISSGIVLLAISTIFFKTEKL